MPYTFSHTIAAAPIWWLSGKRLPLAALIIGSWAPDFPYLFSLTPIDAPGHAPLELLTHCLPEAAIALALWHLWIKKPISDLFGFHHPDRSVSSGSLLLLSAIGIILGAISHVAWDATSHPTGWLVQNFNILRTTHLWIPNFKWIQYGSGILGIFGVCAWYLHFRRNSTPTPLGSRKQWMTFIWIFSVSIILLVGASNWIHGLNSFKAVIVQSMAAAFSGSLVSLVLYATYGNLRHR